MISPSVRLIAICSCLVMLLGCHNTTDRDSRGWDIDGDDLPPGQFANSFTKQIVEAKCNINFACPTRHQESLNQYETKSECMRHQLYDDRLSSDGFQSFGGVWPREIQRAVDDGRVEFDPDQARACLQQLERFFNEHPCAGQPRTFCLWNREIPNVRNHPCLSLPGVAGSLSPACRKVFEGHVPTGESCVTHVECEGKDTLCNMEAVSDQCFGVCVAARNTDQWGQKSEGEDCNFLGGDCDASENLTCEQNMDEDRDPLFVCVPVQSRQEGDPCYNDRVCQPNLVCGTCGVQAVCVPKHSRRVGQACHSTSLCKDGLFCVPGEWTCARLDKLDEGEECPADAACLGDLKCARVEEGGPKICTDQGGWLEQGQKCFGSNADDACRGDLICEYDYQRETSICRPHQLVGPGEHCNSRSRFCEPGLTCVLTGAGYGTHVCVDFHGEGQSCRNTVSVYPAPCKKGLYCSSHICTPKLAEGQSCESNSECEEGILCADGTCQAPQPCELPG